jgi:hypothetical protein
MSPETGTELRFNPPGPGSWELDPVHFPRPATRYWTEMHPEPFKRGFREFTRYYGMLLDGLEYQYVNGFAYKTMAPVAEEEVPARFRRRRRSSRGSSGGTSSGSGTKPSSPPRSRLTASCSRSTPTRSRTRSWSRT